MNGYGSRQAENELRFRSINEKVEELGEELFDDGSEAPRVYDFVCECDDARCTARVAMTIAEYEALRADGRRFLVAPSAEHVDEAVERVVDRSSRYGWWRRPVRRRRSPTPKTRGRDGSRWMW